MKQVVNDVYAELFTTKARYIILLGGRAAGRSTVASQYALAKLKDPGYFRCAIMRLVLSDIRNSIYREITDRADENGILNELRVNDGTMLIESGQNSINAVGFRKSSGDRKSKLKSLANYNTVIIEEADEIPEEDFMQLDDTIRTVKGDITIVLLLNPPPKTHWIIKRWFDLEQSEQPNFYIPKLKPSATDTLFIHSSYLDNIKNIAPQTVAKYEEYRTTKPDHYWAMVRGLVPEVVRGKIYNNWKIVDAIPHEARYKCTWLDFGYTNDPTSIGDVYEYNGGYILDEIAYTKGLLNHQIAAILNSRPGRITIADSAEPKSIDELKLHNCAVLPAQKGSDSIRSGIQVVQSVPISITARSVKTIEEHDNYSWEEDKDGTTLNVPKPGYDHSMDGVRYAITYLKPAPKHNDYEEIEEESPRYSRIGI